MWRATFVFTMASTSLSSADARDAHSLLSKKLQRIEQACNLKTGTVTAVGTEVHFDPSPNEKYQNLDCALAKLKPAHAEKIGFIGNEVYPNTVLNEPHRYIIEGTANQIANLTAAARASGWIIVKSAKADDGTSFLLIQTRQGETVGGADQLMQRIWRKEFGEVKLGRAPEPLVETASELQQ